MLLDVTTDKKRHNQASEMGALSGNRGVRGNIAQCTVHRVAAVVTKATVARAREWQLASTPPTDT